ncbi:MAG: hypothetical protein M1832_002449 [Thelocarpon impressellum]|nr:MAG: hypothetical protein M1832_002449 [Thelocarpon impressellum]
MGWKLKVYLQLGMLMFIVSNILGSTIQITTLPLPVLSTLQASGLVFNSICASLILGEPFTRSSLGGTILVCAGAMLIAAFGAMKEPAHNLDQLLFLLGRRPFVLWMIGQAILVVAIIGGANAIRIMNPRTANSPRTRLARGMAYGGVSGVLSAHSLLVAKSAVELLVRTIVDRVNQFKRWQSWVSLVGLVALALTQLYYLHRGLKLVSTSILYPFVFCVYNIIAILDGLIYFRQTSKLSVLHALLIALGTVILLLGVFALSWRLNDEAATSPVGQNALAPGLAFVDDTTEDEGSSAPLTDEEGAGTPLLDGSGPPSPASNVSPSVARPRVGVSEAAEIWGELEDGIGPQYASPSQTRRRSSTALANASPSETTALLRAATSRTQRSERWRRHSSLLSRPGSRGGGARAPQDAVGGWWRMRWWRRRRDVGEGGGGGGDGNGA